MRVSPQPRFPLTQAVGNASNIAFNLTAWSIENLFMRANLTRFQIAPRSGGQRYAKGELLAATLHSAVSAADQGDVEAQEGLKEFICLVAQEPVAAAERVQQLVEAARSAGYDLASIQGTMRLMPLDEPRVPMSGAISSLEVALSELGMTTALNHYRQAVDSLIDGRSEAANGQMRSMFEEVIIQIAVMKGFTRNAQGAGGRALAYLLDGSILPRGDGGEYIHGLWAITHTNGPHPGTSPAGEAHFRVQALTSASRYLIDRFVTR
jgi:hypothetical protein